MCSQSPFALHRHVPLGSTGRPAATCLFAIGGGGGEAQVEMQAVCLSVGALPWTDGGQRTATPLFRQLNHIVVVAALMQPRQLPPAPSPSVCYCRARTIMIMIGTTYAGAHVDSILASFMRADQPCMTNLHGFQAKARQTCTYFTCFEIRQRSPDSVFPPPAMLT